MTNGEAIREKLKGTIIETMTDEDIALWYGENFMDCDKCKIQNYCMKHPKDSCKRIVGHWLLEDEV